MQNTHHLSVSKLYFPLKALQQPCRRLTWQRARAGRPRHAPNLYFSTTTNIILCNIHLVYLYILQINAPQSMQSHVSPFHRCRQQNRGHTRKIIILLLFSLAWSRCTLFVTKRRRVYILHLTIMKNNLKIAYYTQNNKHKRISLSKLSIKCSC